MLARPDHTSALTLTGFTEAQAGALTTAIDRSATRAVDDLRHDLERWHIALSLYLLIQIGIVLLAFLMVQAVRDPVRAGLAASEARMWHAPAGDRAVSMDRRQARRTLSAATDFCSTAQASAVGTTT